MTNEKKYAKRGRGGVLADEMGLGKTFTTLALILKNKSLESISDRVCIKSTNSISTNALNLCNCVNCNKVKLKLNVKEVLGGTLIVLPTILITNWEIEIKKYSNDGQLKV